MTKARRRQRACGRGSSRSSSTIRRRDRGGDKADFWLLTDEPFDQCRFGRRYVETFDGVSLRVSRPEDTILMKLRWAEISGGSEKHVTDALRVYEVQHEKLEQAYLDQWAATLGVVQLLRHIRDEAKPA